MNLDLIKKTLAKQPFVYEKRGLSALAIIENIEDILNAFLNRKDDKRADILLDVYGLFQSLFVAVDALYDLVIGTTQYKYHININQNPVLRELRFVRNDIVGHPTNRTFEAGTFGFSTIRLDELTKDELVYDTYIVNRNKTSQTSKKIIFLDLINAYIGEKNTILNNLEQFIISKPTDNSCVTLCYALAKNALADRYNLADLFAIKDAFNKSQNSEQDTAHRFVWRLSLLEILYVWENAEFYEFIRFLKQQQAKKLYEIACDLYNLKPEKIFVKLPKVLVQFYKFMDKHPNKVYLLETITEKTHPMFDAHVEELINLYPPKAVLKLLRWLLKFNDANYVYLIGQALATYRKKKQV